ncbi:MAG: insulinase family protein [Micromonosporaceae bacterium]|nr:insulinase family protein [Micromonosporaceae bacterium]
MSIRTVPDLGPATQLRLPESAERTLANGLTVIAVSRPSVPLVEARLRAPFADTHLARSSVLAQTLLSGTEGKSTVDIAIELQKIGGGLNASNDPDRLLVSGNALAPELPRLLELLGEVLTGASYPEKEVETERERLADRIRVALTQPSHLARVALLKRMYGDHPYAVQTPEADEVLDVRSDGLRELHAERVHPNGATLVLVGEFGPEQALDAAEQQLSGWNGAGGPVELPPVPALEPGPLRLLHREGSVQSSLRLAFAAVPRTHPDHAALQLANLVFGGYFSSRWVENIREDKGYTYSPHSVVEHSAAGSALVLSADVSTEVTAPSVLETWYELGRIASLPVSEDELEQARQYALGTLQLALATQSGVAGLASSLAGFGLRLEWLAEHRRRLAEATRADVYAAASRYLAPARGITVVVGDAEQVEQPLGVLTTVERA